MCIQCYIRTVKIWKILIFREPDLPLWPEEQMVIMHLVYYASCSKQPSEEDSLRYYEYIKVFPFQYWLFHDEILQAMIFLFYLQQRIPDDILADWPSDFMKRVLALIPKKLFTKRA